MNENTHFGTYHTFKVLYFSLGENDFAIRLSKVDEILRMTTIRKIPRVPDFIEGIIDLRGSIVVVIDLRNLFLIKGSPTSKPKIIVYSMLGKKIGFVVDSVSRILEKNPGNILPPPPVILKGLAPECLFGIFEEKNNNVLFLDLNKSFSSIEEEGLNQVLQQELSLLIDYINE